MISDVLRLRLVAADQRCRLRARLRVYAPPHDERQFRRLVGSLLTSPTGFSSPYYESPSRPKRRIRSAAAATAVYSQLAVVPLAVSVAVTIAVAVAVALKSRAPAVAVKLLSSAHAPGHVLVAAAALSTAFAAADG